jgi:hypothetical protein
MEPPAQLHLIKGFNLNARIQLNLHTLQLVYPLEGPQRSILCDSEIRIISNCLKELNGTLSSAHLELASLPAPGYLDSPPGTDLTSSPQLRAHVQTEIQKIFLRANILSTRLYLTERLGALNGNHATFIAAQQGQVIKELASLLKNMSKASVDSCATILVSFLTRRCIFPLTNLQARLPYFARYGLPLLHPQKHLSMLLEILCISLVVSLSCLVMSNFASASESWALILIFVVWRKWSWKSSRE